MLAVQVLKSFFRGCFLLLEKIIHSSQMLVILNPLAALLPPLVGQILPLCCGQLQMVILAFPDGRSHCTNTSHVCGVTTAQREIKPRPPSGSLITQPHAGATLRWKFGLGLVLICFVIVLFPPYILCPIHTNHSQSRFFFFLFLHLS